MEVSSLSKLSLEEKVLFSKRVIRRALEEYKNIAVAITGGKDSTLTLWLVREVCFEMDLSLPCCVFIDEGDEFEEIIEFIEKIESLWDLNLIRVKNKNLLENIKEDNFVLTQSLNEENQRYLDNIGFREPYFIFETESFIGTHLMKIFPLKKFLIEAEIEALITGVRWDEQEARREEKFFSPRKDPDHIRVHPILHITERDVWDLIFEHNIPFCPLYKLGYRSIGARSSTTKLADIPAWEQDLENTWERTGRLQEKEKIMASLREVGYM